MIQALQQLFERLDIEPNRTSSPSHNNFAELFGTASETQTIAGKDQAADTTTTGTTTTGTTTTETLGTPDVQGWLNSFYTQQSALNFTESKNDGLSANTSWEPAAGAPDNYSPDSMYGPDQVYQQALENQIGNQFASLSGMNAANLTSQLPGIPSQQAQNAFDSWLANENAQRLASGQAIDTSAYWSDPGPVTLNGTTYTSAQLGYGGPGQSSGPEPIYIAQNNEIAPGVFTVPGYTGTVTGIQPNQYYTLAQLEAAGLQSGQPDAQLHPGSWTEISTSTST